MKKGAYLMLEGGEGLGKDSQAELLLPWLKEKGYEVIETKEPGGTPEAEQIRKILLDKNNSLDPLTELFLYEAARRDLTEKVILPAINSGKIVISKRGFPSTYSYQGFGGGINLNLIKNMNKLAMQDIMPNLIIIIDGSPKVGLKKEINADRFAAKGLQYHEKVRQGYLDIARIHSDISVIVPYLEGNPKEMQNQIQQHIENKLKI